MKQLKGISRIDSERRHQHSWFVRHYATTGTFRKQFADRSYGGKTKALQAAKTWLAEMRKIHPPRLGVDQLAPFQRQPTRSNTGIKGISRTFDRNLNGDKQPVFCITWAEDGQRKSKKISIDQFSSEDEALAEAVRFRKDREREMLAAWRRGRAKSAK